MLTALSDPKAIRQAQDRFEKRLRTGATRYKRKLGWHGGGLPEPVVVYWHPKHKFWAHAAPRESSATNRSWFVFGTQDPKQVTASLTLSCEINVPNEGVNRRVAGAFVSNPQNMKSPIFVAHSGKLGGGRKGVGKEAFLNHLIGGQDQTHPVRWADGKETEMLLLAALDDPGFVSQIGHFVREAQRIKELLVSGVGPKATTKSTKTETSGFSPEFKGIKKYSQKRSIVSTCNHGVVVNALYEELKKRGFEPENDQRDLFLVHGGKVTAVFEAKTAVTTSDLYQAIGQLFFYTSLEPKAPHRILLIPDEPTAETQERINRLGIKVLPYSLSKGAANFHGLDELIPLLKNLPNP